MAVIDRDLLARLPLAEISRVTFHKRDELATDLICCEIALGESVWTFHEELVGWDLLIDHLEKLPHFRADWFETVSRPAFAACETVAFSRR